MADSNRNRESVPHCDQCQMLNINGVNCHEHGCPNIGKVWESGEWVRYCECGECGATYRYGDYHSCNQEDI